MAAQRTGQDRPDHDEESHWLALRTLAPLLGPLIVMALLAVFWASTPLGAWLRREAAQPWAISWRGEAVRVPIVLFAYILGGLLVVPINALMLATVVSFGPLEGGLYALAGALLNGIVTYALGRQLGAARVDRLLGEGAQRIRNQVFERGVLAVTILRVVPLAPYTLVNVVLGAVRISFGAYVLGTCLGLLPGLVALGLAGETLLRAFREPDGHTIATAIAVVLGLAGLSVLLRWWLARSRS